MLTLVCSRGIFAAAELSPQMATRPLFIREFQVRGAHKVSRTEIEQTVYLFLGPGRTTQDIEGARAALEKLYQTKGYQSVSVQIPEQQVSRGVVVLQVTEQAVGRLRVHDSRYFSIEKIRHAAPSLAEGQVPNFNDVASDIVALNQLPDRRVTPSVHAGVEPNTVDVDLTVKDTFPLHGSLELNNRYSPDTSELRLNGSVSYNNLWQLGHSFGLSFQISPEDLDEVKVFSGYYVARFASVPWLSLIAQGVKQESNVSTISGLAVAGRGEVVGTRAVFTLPTGKDFYHSFSLGVDYKHFEQGVNLGTGQIVNTPITYYPFSASYNATWNTSGAVTDMDATLTWHVREFGSETAEFDVNRYKASGSFVDLRGSISHTHGLPGDAQIYGKIVGQVADQPLVNSEEFTGGGLGTVRGYLEAEALGDDGVFGTVELRTPSLTGSLDKEKNEWRVYAFADGGVLTVHDPLPQQKSTFTLASIGLGSRLKLQNHFNASIDLSLPLIDLTQTSALDPRITFRLWADF